MISDTFPGQGHAIGSQVTIAIQISNAEKAKKYSISYKKVEKLSCHFKKHSGAQRYGQVKDKFNIEWQVTTSTTEQK